MKVERDIAGMALPFAAGVAASVWAGEIICFQPLFSSATASLTLLCSFLLLVHPNRRNFDPITLQTVIFILFVSCGILCGIRAHIVTVYIPVKDSIITWIRHMGTATAEAIDGIGFRDSDTNAMIKALIIGDRSDIPSHITEAFRTSGASHILALSGLHLGIIYGIIGKALSVLGNTVAAQRSRTLITVMSCGLYTIATGAGASITRAFIFILLGESAKATGRHSSLGSILMASMLIHLTIDPMIIKDVGFQRSYAAMAGIAFIFPHLRDFWHQDTEAASGYRPMKRIWETVAMSVSCQLTTGPLAYFYFRSFPVNFLLTNLISLPLTALIIPAALLTLVLECYGICPEILLRATEMLVTALSAALKVISSM